MAQKTGTSLSASPTLTLNFEAACAGASELLAHMRKAISQLSIPGKFRHVFSDFPVSWLEGGEPILLKISRSIQCGVAVGQILQVGWK